MKALQDEGALLNQFIYELSRASEFHLAMALITPSGLNLISRSMDLCLKKGGRGRILFGVDLPTDPDSISKLCELQKTHKDRFQVRRFQPGRRFFHPKLSIFVRRTGRINAILGSSNLTGGGFTENHEANLLIEENSITRSFVEYFEEHFQGAHARKVDESWLEQYRVLWRKRKRVEKEQRTLRERARTLGKPPALMPREIKGHSFAVTGRIIGWPRESKLYPAIKRRGGRVAVSAGAMGSIDCLVQGEFYENKKTTKKLKRANQLKIPIITEDQFFKLMRIKNP